MKFIYDSKPPRFPQQKKTKKKILSYKFLSLTRWKSSEILFSFKWHNTIGDHVIFIRRIFTLFSPVFLQMRKIKTWNVCLWLLSEKISNLIYWTNLKISSSSSFTFFYEWMNECGVVLFYGWIWNKRLARLTMKSHLINFDQPPAAIELAKSRLKT